MANFLKAFQATPLAFREWLLREATAYFEDHKRRKRGENTPNHRDYWKKEAIERHIPPELLSGLVQHLSDGASLPCDGNLRDFVVDNVTNLVAISSVYENAARQDGRVGLPYVARAEIIIQGTADHECIPHGLLQQMASGVLNQALIDLGNRLPEELPRILVQLRERPLWTKLRELFCQLSSCPSEQAPERWRRIQSVLLDHYEEGEELKDDALLKHNLQILKRFHQTIVDPNYEDRLHSKFADLYPAVAAASTQREARQSRCVRLSGEATFGLLFEIIVVILDRLDIRQPFVIWGFVALGLLLILDSVVRGERARNLSRITRVILTLGVLTVFGICGKWIYGRTHQIPQDLLELRYWGIPPHLGRLPVVTVVVEPSPGADKYRSRYKILVLTRVADTSVDENVDSTVDRSSSFEIPASGDVEMSIPFGKGATKRLSTMRLPVEVDMYLSMIPNSVDAEKLSTIESVRRAGGVFFRKASIVWYGN